MKYAAIGGYVLDVAALIGACRRKPYPESVIWGTVITHGVLVVPAAVLGEARARIPRSGLDILDVVLSLPNTVIADLNDVVAARCGTLLAAVSDDVRGQLSAAHAAIEGVNRGWPIATDRAGLLTRLLPAADVDQLP
ncbi:MULTISPECIES: hypothetical protein [Nocardia]|uniref:PIN domain-containing protein n=1 Tax=Nocardia arthritidis TaxID=228602 RepID=A0A6G9YBZ3_9NOCA|nr:MULTISPECIES: hypothetical protein [Nocardia]QIS10533.1 hypothetical protein F5544_13220 [Nocardia arthritidis]